MIQTAERQGVGTFGQCHAQLLGAAAAVFRCCYARATTAAAQHLASVWIGGKPLLIDAIAKVLHHQLPGGGIHTDQEITAGIELDRAVGVGIIQLAALLGRERCHDRW